MSYALKVRDRTTNKVREATVDQDVYERLKGYVYLTDKNSKEPFREEVKGNKRPRIALKRDVMNFSHGDPRRVCYVDKSNVFDCRKSNLKTKAAEEAQKKMVKVVKTLKIDSPVGETKAAAVPPIVAAATPRTVAKTPDLDFKRTLLSKISQDKLVELVPMDALLAAWAETNGYEKKHA